MVWHFLITRLLPTVLSQEWRLNKIKNCCTRKYINNEVFSARLLENIFFSYNPITALQKKMLRGALRTLDFDMFRRFLIKPILPGVTFGVFISRDNLEAYELIGSVETY